MKTSQTMSSMQDVVIPVNEDDSWSYSSSDSGCDSDESSDRPEPPKATLMSLPDEILLKITRFLQDSSFIAALAATNKRFYHLAGKDLYSPKETLIESVKSRMKKAIEAKNTVHFDRIFTHVNTPWGALELQTAIDQEQESMALHLLTHDTVKSEVIQATTTTNNPSFVKSLSFAVSNHMHAILRTIFQIPGTDPNVRCAHGGTLLHEDDADLETRTILLQAGADATVRSIGDDHTTLRYSLFDAASFDLLLRHGALPTVEDLCIARYYASLPVFEVILIWDLDTIGDIAHVYDRQNRDFIDRLRWEARPATESSTPEIEVRESVEWALNDPWPLGFFANEPDYCD